VICASPKYYSGDKINMNELGGHVRVMGENNGAYRVLMGKL
jgi:hypothetical protein